MIENKIAAKTGKTGVVFNEENIDCSVWEWCKAWKKKMIVQ